jgi:hypothetical protein
MSNFKFKPMKVKILFINAIVLALSFASCKKQAGPEGPQGTQGIAGPSLSGNLKGFVNHYDLSGAKITTNLAGDSVSIDGTSNVSITDATGMYNFSGLNTGVYNLTVKRAGYGWTKLQDVQFTGGGDTYRNANISKVPTTNVNTFMTYDTTINTINYVRIRGTVPSTNYTQSLIVYVGVPGKSTCNSATANQINQYVINIGPSTAATSSYSKNIPTQELYDVGYASSNTAYFSIYTVGGNTNASSYSDLSNNRPILTALGTAPLFASAAVQ